MASLSRWSAPLVLPCFLVSSLTLISPASSALSGYGKATYEKPPYHYTGCPGLHRVLPGQVAKATNETWNDGAVCGEFFTVTCTDDRVPSPCNQVDPMVEVMIVGYCRNCKGVIVLTEEMFSQITTTNVRSVTVDYEQVEDD